MNSQWHLKNKFTDMYLIGSESGLKSALPKRDEDVPMLSSLKGKGVIVQILAQAVAELEEYFVGKRKAFTVPLDADGTEFQKSVWRQLSRIPYGKTCSYKDIAVALAKPQAMRAVGGANGKNPLCIIVPCHRVIAADGSIGGYTSGLPLKRKLLELEGGPLFTLGINA